MQRSLQTAHDPAKWVVAIPSFNHADDAIVCLRSLWEADPKAAGVLFIDDASTDDAVGTIAAWARGAEIPTEVVTTQDLENIAGLPAWLTLVSSAVNGGFSVSCNRALRHIRDRTEAPFAFLLNNDAAVTPTYFRDLADALERVPDSGLLSGTIYEWDQKTVWYAGGRFNPLRSVSEHHLELPQSSLPRETDFVCGCTMLISREVLEKVGLLPEIYSPAYCEDSEYCIRAQRAGYPLVYAPGAVAFHKVGSSHGRKVRPPAVTFWFNRNRAYAVRRNYTGWQRYAGLSYFTVTKLLRAAWELVRGRPRSGAAFVRSVAHGLFDSVADRR